MQLLNQCNYLFDNEFEAYDNVWVNSVLLYIVKYFNFSPVKYYNRLSFENCCNEKKKIELKSLLRSKTRLCEKTLWNRQGRKSTMSQTRGIIIFSNFLQQE